MLKISNRSLTGLTLLILTFSFLSLGMFAQADSSFKPHGVGELKMTAVIRNVFVQYKNNKFSARIGMIDVDQFIHPL